MGPLGGQLTLEGLSDAVGQALVGRGRCGRLAVGEGLVRAGSARHRKAAVGVGHKSEEPGGGFESHLTTAPTCWQPASPRGPRKAFVLVGVIGIEPVTSAV